MSHESTASGRNAWLMGAISYVLLGEHALIVYEYIFFTCVFVIY